MSWRDKLIEYESVDSTMSTTRRLALAGAAEGTAVRAAAQTHGRGRHGKAWFSPAAAGLWMTVLLRPPTAAHARMAELALVGGIAVWQVLQPLTSVPLTLKWPNDVLAGGHKLAGILLEAEFPAPGEACVLMGIGINLAAASTQAIPSGFVRPYVGLRSLATAAALPAIADVTALGERVRTNLARTYGIWRGQGLSPLLPTWQRADALRGKWVRADGPTGPVQGEALGVGDDGRLRLKTLKGILFIAFGEVHTLRGGAPPWPEPKFDKAGTIDSESIR